MRWLADECVHAPVVSHLRWEGHDVVYMAETPGQTRDADLAEEALRDGRILLTEDKDFGEIAFQKRQSVPGIVLLRFSSARRSQKWPNLKAAIVQHGKVLCDGFTVIEDQRVRHQPYARDDKQN